MEQKWAEICAASDDEDEIADYGNDLIGLRLLLKSTREAAVGAFGANVTNFGRRLL